MLKADSIERIAGLAGGCVWLAFNGGVEAGVVGAVAATGLAAATIDLTRKTGPESQGGLKKVIRSVRKDFDTWATGERVDLSGELLAAEDALVQELHGCMLDRRALAQAALDPDGFPASATRLILNALADRSPLFREHAGLVVGRDFATTVISSALRAAVEQRAYFEQLQPHLMFEALKGIGVIQRDVTSLVRKSDATYLMVTRMFEALNVAGSIERATELGLSNRQVLNLLKAFALDHVALENAETMLLEAATRLRELEALHARTRYDPGHDGDAVKTSAENALADADIPAATALIVSEFVRARIEDGDRRYDPELRRLFVSRRRRTIGASILSFADRLIPGWAWTFNRLHPNRDPPSLLLPRKADAKSSPPLEEGSTEEQIGDFLAIDEVKIEFGYALLSLISDVEGRRLTDQVRALRRALAQEFGFVMPSVRILDSMKLAPQGYLVRIMEMEAGAGEIRLGSLLAMDPAGRQVELPGEHTKDPAFGLPATWIDESLREEASFRGYTIVDPSTVVTTHLTEILKENMSELLSYTATAKLVDTLSPQHRSLLELRAKDAAIATLQRVLQGLLEERVSIRDLGRITEAVAECAGEDMTFLAMIEHVRSRLARQLCWQNKAEDGTLPIVTLSTSWERAFSESLVGDGPEKQLAMSQTELQNFIRRTREVFERAAMAGESAVLLTGPEARPYVRSIIKRFRGQTVVMSQNEVHPKARLRTIGSI